MAATLKPHWNCPNQGQKKSMPQKRETLTSRVARLEELHADLAEKVKILLDSQIKTDERFRQTDERLRESGEKVDKRIGDLVSAIGNLISRMPPLR
jgi:predicted  nucleic acid-binding Zn-ribbon protein